MARAHHYRRPDGDVPELEMTTFLNLMVVLVPFLLITAVFSRITVQELHLPSADSGSAATPPELRVEVLVRETGLEITNGNDVIAAIPKLDGNYDLGKLADYLTELKREYPDKEDASVLLERQIEYDHLIQVMDTVRSREIEDDAEVRRYALFPTISVGYAP